MPVHGLMAAGAEFCPVAAHPPSRATKQRHSVKSEDFRVHNLIPHHRGNECTGNNLTCVNPRTESHNPAAGALKMHFGNSGKTGDARIVWRLRNIAFGAGKTPSHCCTFKPRKRARLWLRRIDEFRACRHLSRPTLPESAQDCPPDNHQAPPTEWPPPAVLVLNVHNARFLPPHIVDFGNIPPRNHHPGRAEKASPHPQ